jgi:hypothetical protein
VLYDGTCEAFCVAAAAAAAAAVPVARVAARWTMVRVALVRVGEATPRSIIWRFAGGGWP